MISVKQLLDAKAHVLFKTGPNDLVSDALNILANHKIGALLVMDGEKLVGILSERDCAIRVALPGKRADQTKVSEIMTEAVITADPSQTLESCIEEMNTRDIRHLPIVEKGKVIGVVSIGDVSKEMLKLQFQLIRQLESYIHGAFSA